MLRFFCSIGFLFSLQLAVAQVDSLGSRADSSNRKRASVATGIRVGVDVYRLFLWANGSNFKGTEVCADVNFNQWIYAAHAGYAARSSRLAGYTPYSEGYYASLGCSRNVFADNANMLSFGVRVAGSHYAYTPRAVKTIEPITNRVLISDFESETCTAVWAELVAGMRATVLGGCMMGFEIRVKPRLYSKVGLYSPYQIPGYGFYSSKVGYGFNYFIYINIPTKKRQ